VAAETGLAPAVKGATGLPLVGLTLGTDGALSARFWEKQAARRYERRWCESVRVSGDCLRVTYGDSLLPPQIGPELTRTVSA
jgi:molybdopterin-synthase adenylyltransferase